MSEINAPNLARATVSGTLWNYATYYSGRLLVFLSTIILARLLTEEDFGVAAYALVAISFLDVMNDFGIGPALIFHHEKPETADTAFWLGLAIGFGLFVVSWFGAVLVGDFFHDPRAVPITRVLALTFPISAFGNVHDALLRKRLHFKKRFIPDLAQAIGKGIISIVLALLGFGAWSLVLGQLAGKFVTVIAYWIVLPWRPAFRFVRQEARALLSFGMNIVWVNLLGILLLNIDYLFVGRFLGAAALGVYTLAFRIPDLVIMQFCNVIAQVVFPVFARMRDDAAALRRGFITTTSYVALITVPLGLGIALCAQPFVLAFFTDRWVDAIPVMRAIAIYALLLSLTYNAGDVYKAQGHPDILTKLGIVRLILLAPALWWAVTVPANITAVGWTQAFMALIAAAMFLIVAVKMLDTSIWAIVQALRPAAISGALMVPAVLAALVLTANMLPIVQLIVCVLVGAFVYLGSLWLFQRELMFQAGKMLFSVMARR